MDAVVRVVVVVALAACSGTAGSRERAETTAVATHCDRHGCPTATEAVHLGDGCYVVADRLYQCGTDGPSEVSCFEIPRCAEVCETTITDGRGLEISTERCEANLALHRAAHAPPVTCDPVRVIALASRSLAPAEVSLPRELAVELFRSGRDKAWYQAEACATDAGLVIGEPTSTTGFPELDDILRGELARITLAPGTCETPVLQASPFVCR